jgi:Tfp pilus assembly protein PilF
MMKRLTPLLLPAALALLVAAAGCSHGGNTQHPAAQENFGVQMARMNLWREAMFRFQRAVQMNPQDAMAHNNLAVAYEANGDFDNAAREYREAMRLDKGNQYIQKNYSRYVEFLSRNRKRQQRGTATAAAASTAGATGAATAGGATPAPAGAQPAASPNPLPPPLPPVTPSGQPAQPQPPQPKPPGVRS